MHQAGQRRGEEGAEGQVPIRRTIGGPGLKSRVPLSPHPLQCKMLLVTLWGQAITHKL